MYDHILIPTDGSDEAEKGATHGIDLAAALGATVHALYVINLPGAPRTVYISEDDEKVREEYRQYGEKVTGEVCDLAARAGVECVAAIEHGAVHQEIVDYAEGEDIDVIVMGTGYRGKIGGLLGSTAEKVVRSTSVPVTTVRSEEFE